MAQPQSAVQNRLIRFLPPPDYALLSPFLEPVRFKLRAIVAAADTPLEHAYFINKGIFSLLAQRTDERVEVGMVGPEGIVGAGAGFGAIHTPYMILCQAEAEVLRLDVGALEQVVRQSPSLAAVLGRYLHYLTVQIGQTAYANASLNIEARLARWILTTDDRTEGYELTLTHEFMAVMLGTRRPGVTTAVHVLEGAGMIKAERGVIVIRDRARLEHLASDAYGVAEAEYERLFG
jgi:CRP-like cAMP-binding protein